MVGDVVVVSVVMVRVRSGHCGEDGDMRWYSSRSFCVVVMIELKVRANSSGYEWLQP